MSSKRTKEFATEQAFQEWTAKEVKALGLFGWHTPNGGHRSKRAGSAMQRAGTVAGVPDWLFVRRALPSVAIELKLPGGALSPVQVEWQRRWLEAAGLYYLVHSTSEFFVALYDSRLASLSSLLLRGYTR